MRHEQKIIGVSIHRGVDAQHLAETLNTLATDGWHVQAVSTVLSRKGGAIYALKNAYYADTYYLILEISDTRISYRCLLQQREKDMDEDLAKLNAALEEQARDGFSLAHLLHATAISTNEERQTPGTIAHILLFAKEESNDDDR